MKDEDSESASPTIVGGMGPPQFFIAGGVRRAVAARESAVPDIAAVIVEPGKPDVQARIRLSQLHSPKTSVSRDARYLRIEAATRAGTQLPPIEIQPLGAPGQGKSVPLSQVQLQ